jgi:hypothetical protein
LEKNSKWQPKTKMASDRFFLNRNSTETPSSGFIREKIDANLLIISCFILKSQLGILKFDKMAEKFKMASETKIFVILLSKLSISKTSTA